MQLQKRDILTKTLLDTQERVRDFMHFADELNDPALQNFFRNYAESEGHHAEKLQKFLSE